MFRSCVLIFFFSFFSASFLLRDTEAACWVHPQLGNHNTYEEISGVSGALKTEKEQLNALFFIVLSLRVFFLEGHWGVTVRFLSAPASPCCVWDQYSRVSRALKTRRSKLDAFFLSFYCVLFVEGHWGGSVGFLRCSETLTTHASFRLRPLGVVANKLWVDSQWGDNVGASPSVLRFSPLKFIEKKTWLRVYILPDGLLTLMSEVLCCRDNQCLCSTIFHYWLAVFPPLMTCSFFL